MAIIAWWRQWVMPLSSAQYSGEWRAWHNYRHFAECAGREVEAQLLSRKKLTRSDINIPPEIFNLIAQFALKSSTWKLC